VARVILFDVEHGFCAFVKSDTGCTLMIDCGKASNFSAVDYVLASEMSGITQRNGYNLTKLIITHPHDDHIEDISRVISKLPPSILLRQTYNWNGIKAPDAGASEYKNLDTYSEWQTKYSEPVSQEPNWGMNVQTFCLTPIEAKAIEEAKYVNNSSYVTVVTFIGSQHQEKFLFGADVEKAGWDALLVRNASFRIAVKDVDFFVVPHHGHASGFSTELFGAMGRRPILNLISVTSRDEHVDSRYSSAEYAIGVDKDGGKRYSFSTRNDGAIFIDVDGQGKFSLSTRRIPPNLVSRLTPPPRLRW
jgi:competence protein ComEC